MHSSLAACILDIFLSSFLKLSYALKSSCFCWIVKHFLVGVSGVLGVDGMPELRKSLLRWGVQSSSWSFLLLDPVVSALEKLFLALEMHFSCSNFYHFSHKTSHRTLSISLSNHVVSDARISLSAESGPKSGVIRREQNKIGCGRHFCFPAWELTHFSLSTYLTCGTVYT